MRFMSLNPALAEPLKQVLPSHDWELQGQDAGQAHLVGWGYVMRWSKLNHSVWLHYKEIQGKAEAQLEMTPGAFTEIHTIVTDL